MLIPSKLTGSGGRAHRNLRCDGHSENRSRHLLFDGVGQGHGATGGKGPGAVVADRQETLFAVPGQITQNEHPSTAGSDPGSASSGASLWASNRIFLPFSDGSVFRINSSGSLGMEDYPWLNRHTRRHRTGAHLLEQTVSR